MRTCLVDYFFFFFVFNSTGTLHKLISSKNHALEQNVGFCGKEAYVGNRKVSRVYLKWPTGHGILNKGQCVVWELGIRH